MRLFHLLLAAFALALPALVLADDALKVIGYLTPAGEVSLRERVFFEGLRDRGWIDGKNMRIEYRRAGNDPSRLRQLALDLVRQHVDLIVANSTPAVQAAKAATTSIPVVSISADPVTNGFVKSLAKPGGNITGVSMMMPQLAGKRLQLLRELVPDLRRVGFLGHGVDPSHKIFLKEAQQAASHVGIEVRAYIVRQLSELEAAFGAMKADRIEALIVQPLFINQLGATQTIVRQAAKLSLPTVSDGESFADAGGLVFYGPDPLAIYKRLAVYVDRVLKGANPAELAMEQPQDFLMVINLSTAKELGLNVPQSTLLRADRVVQ